MKLIKRLRCKHEQLSFVRNIFGDQINYSGGKRSLWKCAECEKSFGSGWLFELEKYDGQHEGEKFLVPRTAVVFSQELLSTLKFKIKLTGMSAGFVLWIELLIPGGAFGTLLVFSLSFMTCLFYTLYRRMKNLHVLSKE